MLSVLVAAAMSPCPALASIGRPAAPLPAQRCRADACVRAAYGARAHARRGRRNGARVTRLVAARAWGSPAAVATKDEADTPWWKQHDEHWTEATTEDEFWELVNGAEESVVLVGACRARLRSRNAGLASPDPRPHAPAAPRVAVEVVCVLI